jgi:hypothetical protein
MDQVLEVCGEVQQPRQFDFASIARCTDLRHRWG